MSRWRVRIIRKGNHHEVLTIKAESKKELHDILAQDTTIVFAETTGGDGHTANDLIFDRR